MKEESFESVAARVSAVSIVINILLAAFKFIAGAVGRSGAMISDAVHSSSDVLGSLIVIVGVKMSGKSSDKDHPYGHERMECVAAIVLAVVLCITGLLIGRSAVENLLHGTAENTVTPGVLPLVAAIVSIARLISSS